MSNNQKHTVATDALETLGKCPIPDNSGRDAIHLAVEPVIAGQILHAGERIKIMAERAWLATANETIGIVDPFVEGPIHPGTKFWLVVLPRTISSLRHVWSHPAFPDEPVSAYHEDADEHYVTPPEKLSELWMRAWAVEHLSDDYYDDGGGMDAEQAYRFAIEAGHDTNIGSFESARDHIDGTWWDHWERITGQPGKRDEYFSCAC
jgi:hypothetical protein